MCCLRFSNLLLHARENLSTGSEIYRTTRIYHMWHNIYVPLWMSLSAVNTCEHVFNINIFMSWRCLLILTAAYFQLFSSTISTCRSRLFFFFPFEEVAASSPRSTFSYKSFRSVGEAAKLQCRGWGRVSIFVSCRLL